LAATEGFVKSELIFAVLPHEGRRGNCMHKRGFEGLKQDHPLTVVLASLFWLEGMAG
jgi:hypothetical protein